jgi:predicted Zn-dependent protease
VPPIGGPLPAADEALLARAQSQLAQARTAADIEAAYAVARELGARYPGHQRVQHTAAEIAYRASRWGDAVRHFHQGGDPGEAQPLLLFYMAVSLWESGNRQEAVTVMRRCDGKLRPTPFVQGYRDKILGAAPGA